jgi:hypothetical protein
MEQKSMSFDGFQLISHKNPWDFPKTVKISMEFLSFSNYSYFTSVRSNFLWKLSSFWYFWAPKGPAQLPQCGPGQISAPEKNSHTPNTTKKRLYSLETWIQNDLSPPIQYSVTPIISPRHSWQKWVENFH